MALCVERSLVSPRWSARWQLLLHRWCDGRRVKRQPGCGPGEVAVLAEVRETAFLNASPDIRPGVLLGRSASGDSWLVTARVPLARVEGLLADRRVLRMEPALELRPLIEEATVALGAQPMFLPSTVPAAQGAGALVGVVDSSLDLSHENLRDAGAQPRVVASWRQAFSSRGDERAPYGAVYDRRELWLAEHADSSNATGDSHAMRMLDMAAGNGRATGIPGVAPRAEIVHVDLSAGDGRGQTMALGDTVRLVEGMKFIFDQARDAPCAVNVSLGTQAGGHDGGSLVEQAMDLLASAASGRAVFVAAGNHFAAEQHASGMLVSTAPCELSWHVPCAGRTRHSVEVWYSAADQFEIELVAPRGLGGCRVEIDANCRLTDEASGRTVALVAHEGARDGRDRVATVFLERDAPAGVWTVVLRPKRDIDGRFHAWIVPEDPIRPVFVNHVDTTCTLNALACGRHTIAVGAYDARRPHLPLAWYTSAGPTRDGRPKPDVSAPGHRVWVARADRKESAAECSGTSLAAAAGAGVAALVLGHARSLGLSLPADELAHLLRETARLHPPAHIWDDRYGFGRLDAATAIFLVEQLAAARQERERVTPSISEAIPAT